MIELISILFLVWICVIIINAKPYKAPKGYKQMYIKDIIKSKKLDILSKLSAIGLIAIIGIPIIEKRRKK